MRVFCCMVLGVAAIAWAAPQREDVRKHFEQAVDLYETHDDTGESMAEAAAEFQRALQLDPRFAPAIAYLGFIAAERQQPEQAAAAYRRALEIDSRCAEARVGLARLELAAGRYAGALRELRQAVADHPESTLARRDLAFTLTSEGAHPTPRCGTKPSGPGRSWRESILRIATRTTGWRRPTNIGGLD